MLEAAETEDTEARRARLAGEHRLDRRTVRHRQAHQHSLHPRSAECRAPYGSLLTVGYKQDPVFGFEVPTECEGVPSQILDPANTWPSREQYFDKYDALAARFIENFKLMMAECPEHILEAGPKRLVANGSLNAGLTLAALSTGMIAAGPKCTARWPPVECKACHGYRFSPFALGCPRPHFRPTSLPIWRKRSLKFPPPMPSCSRNPSAPPRDSSSTTI